MVWIQNKKIVRQYFKDIVEARRMAILWLENNAKRESTEKVFFYQKANSREPSGYVMMENIRGKPTYYWYHYTRAYGVVQTPLYKNGKLNRG